MGERRRTDSGETKPRRGSWLSERQLAHAVVHNQIVEFVFLSGRPSISGWVAGWDDYHWFVVTETCRKYLIHKASVCVEIHARDRDALPEGVERIVSPFRGWVQANVYSQKESSS